MKGSSIRKCHYALSIFLLLGISVCPFLMYQEHASAMQNSTSCRGAAFREDVKALYQTNTDEHPQMLVENLPSDTAIGGAARPPGEASNKETSPPYNPKHRTPMRSSGCLNSWENVQRSRREIRENPYQHDPVEQRYPIRDDANRVAVEAESEQKSTANIGTAAKDKTALEAILRDMNPKEFSLKEGNTIELKLTGDNLTSIKRKEKELVNQNHSLSDGGAGRAGSLRMQLHRKVYSGD